MSLFSLILAKHLTFMLLYSGEMPITARILVYKAMPLWSFGFLLQVFYSHKCFDTADGFNHLLSLPTWQKFWACVLQLHGNHMHLLFCFISPNAYCVE